MTRYTVVWDSVSQNELADIWMSSTNRAAVTAAAHFIDVELSQDAPRKVRWSPRDCALCSLRRYACSS